MYHKPDELSGGQKQRTAIARAMANNPTLILADEPTGALDSETGHHIMDLFHKLHREQGKTIVLITHSRELAEETERIITLRDGRIVDDTGSNGEITNDRDVNDIREQGERKADTGKRGAIC